jgi:hypothetical protein
MLARAACERLAECRASPRRSTMSRHSGDHAAPACAIHGKA